MLTLSTWSSEGAYGWSDVAHTYISVPVAYFAVDLALCLYHPDIFGPTMILHAAVSLGGYSLMLVRSSLAPRRGLI